MSNQKEKYSTIMKNIPVLKRSLAGTPDGVTSLYYQLTNPTEIDHDIPYVAAIDRFMENPDVSHDRVILVSDELGIARKAAAVLSPKAYDAEARSDELDEYDSVFDDDDFFDDDEYFTDFDEYDSEPSFSLDLRLMFQDIDINSIKKNDSISIPVPNPYHTVLQISTLPSVNLLIRGLEDPGDRELKMDSIEAILDTRASRVMILVPRSEANSLWVKDLARTLNFSVLNLPDCDDYLKSFAQNNTAKIPAQTAKLAYRHARTDLGQTLVEDDLAWYMTTPNAFHNQEKTALDELKDMIGLGDAKKAAEELAAIEFEKTMNPSLSNIRKHMLFAGNPGTGKTTVASIMARILSETGNSRANVVTVSRSDLIGKFVGHTAPKVAKIFNEARGGVLFVDEAGFFLNDRRSDGFTSEAIREFVRYMELYDDVTVIFAMYQNEVKDFLALDEGLRSRICREVTFKDYTDKELIAIAHKMSADQGYRLSPKADPIITDYLTRLRQNVTTSYGNAREVRKVIDSAIICHAIRNSIHVDDCKYSDLLNPADIREGIARLEPETDTGKVTLGFAARTRVQEG